MSWAFLLLAVILGGCDPPDETVPQPGAESEAFKILRGDDEGPIALVFTPHPLWREAPPDGVRRALERAAPAVPCAAAVFYFEERDRAKRWLFAACDRRRAAGTAPVVILAGHSFGATEAGELAKTLLADRPEATIRLLLTVDAVKSTTIGKTAGLAPTVLSLANPLPGAVYFVAYDGTPKVDGRRVLAHVNYYQLETKLYHGGPIAGASENHLVQAVPASAVNHGNVDDFAYPMILGDLQAALRGGPGR